MAHPEHPTLPEDAGQRKNKNTGGTQLNNLGQIFAILEHLFTYLCHAVWYRNMFQL